MTEIKSLAKINKDMDVKIVEDAMRRAEAFPVQGGDIVPVRRKSWFKTVEQKESERPPQQLTVA